MYGCRLLCRWGAPNADLGVNCEDWRNTRSRSSDTAPIALYRHPRSESNVTDAFPMLWNRRSKPSVTKSTKSLKRLARVTGLEPATSGVTGRHSNQLSYTRASDAHSFVRRRGGHLRGSQKCVKRVKHLCEETMRREVKTSLPAHDDETPACIYALRNAERTHTRPPVRAISSVGRALRLHRRCRRFEPVIAHHKTKITKVPERRVSDLAQ